MTLFEVNPICDDRWTRFLERSPKASVFHTAGWLKALQRTYGYRPVAWTSSPPDQEMKNGLVFCEVRSWLTGRRMVSLPFSDHCQPLGDDPEELSEMLGQLQLVLKGRRLKYIELRPLNLRMEGVANFTEGTSFCFHKLDLTPGADRLFRNSHQNAVQQMIRRAQREKLTYEEGKSEMLLKKFYALMLKTRRRHKLLPQPLTWFRNLIDCLGESLKIRVASKDGRPVASIITVVYGNTLTYKYGCSDERFNNLGGTAFLLWKAILEATERGLHEFDLGRSDSDASGLILFKNRWGSVQSTLTYWRWPARIRERTNPSMGMHLVREILAYLPDVILTAGGNALYRHAG